MIKKNFFLVFILFTLLINCSQTNPCDFSIIFPQHSIVENGGWQDIYFIPYSNEYASCNEFMDMTDKQLQDISETNATIPIILSTLTGKNFNKLTHNRYYIVVRAKDLKCNFQWERCKDINLNQCGETTLEIEMNKKDIPVLCNGLCMEGSCEIIDCTTNEKCINNNVCDGTEFCGEDNICHSGDGVANGTECNNDDNITTEEICVSGWCIERRCGDGYVEQNRGEECDPPNTRCSENCKWINGSDNDSGTDVNSDIETDIKTDANNDINADTQIDYGKDINIDLSADADDLNIDIFNDTKIDTAECVDNDGDQFGDNCLSGHDCNDANPNCDSDCTDVDNDSYCINHDCDDTSQLCNTDCSDNNGNGIADCLNLCPENPHLIGSYKTDGRYSIGIYLSENYAYLGNYTNELEIVDISNIRNPFVVSYYQTSDYALWVFAQNDYVFVANYDSGLSIIDVSDHSQPQLVSTYKTPGDELGLFVRGDYVYVADHGFGIRVIDITNILNPQEVGFNSDYYAETLFIRDDYAYIASIDGLWIVDISSPDAPDTISSYTTPSNSYNIYVYNNYAYVGTESTGMRIINISDIYNPNEEGFFSTDVISGIFVQNNYAFVIDNSSFLYIVDISYTSQPFEVSRYALDYAQGIQVIGNYVYVADYGEGLKIISIACND